MVLYPSSEFLAGWICAYIYRNLISLDVKKETSTIVFNSADLQLGNASIHSDALQMDQVDSSRKYDPVQERTALHFAKPLPAGSKANLKITFDGKLTGNMMGYYKSSYDVDGKKKFYTLTQFEVCPSLRTCVNGSMMWLQPTAARRAFPCWDEPLLKATFAITLLSREDTVNLSNMPVATESAYPAQTSQSTEGSVSALTSWMGSLTFGPHVPKDKWKITKFETTPPVSLASQYSMISNSSASVRCLLTWSHMQMGTSSTSRAHTLAH